MGAVRFVALAALATWVGGMVAFGVVFVPATLGLLPAADAADHALVGAVLTAALRRFHLLAWTCGAVVLLSLIVMKLMGPPPRGFVARITAVALMLAIALYTGLWRTGPLDARTAALMAVNAVTGLALLSWYVRE